MNDINQHSFITYLNEVIAKPSLATIPLFISLAFAMSLMCINITASAIMVLVGFFAYTVTQWIENKNKSFDLIYENQICMNPHLSTFYTYLRRAFDSQQVWVIDHGQAVHDSKRNAGAAYQIQRSRSVAEIALPKHVRSNLEPIKLSSQRLSLYFLPDIVLIHDGRHYIGLSYQGLSIKSHQERFIEYEAIPSDSTQVGTTYRYVNKDGTPDRRFNNNYQIPILLYSSCTIEAPGVRITIQFSNPNAANDFELGLNAMRSP